MEMAASETLDDLVQRLAEAHLTDEVMVGALIGPQPAGEPAERPPAPPAPQPAAPAAAAPALPPEMKVGLLDLKGLAKVPIFDSKDEMWEEWKFRFEAVMDLVGVGDVMRLAAGLEREITLEEMNEENRHKARLLYQILLQSVTGKALTLLRAVARSSGLEAWRRLNQEWMPYSAIRHSALLVKLLSPVWDSSSDYMMQLTE